MFVIREILYAHPVFLPLKHCFYKKTIDDPMIGKQTWGQKFWTERWHRNSWISRRFYFFI